MTIHEQPAAATGAEAESEARPAEPVKIMTHAEMNTHISDGLVKPLGDTIAFAVHYANTWWILYEGGWIRADHHLNELLDAESERITTQDAIIARNATIRAAARDKERIEGHGSSSNDN